MAFNELEAIKMIDEGKITDDQIKLLTRVRDGLAKADVEEEKGYKELVERGLVMEVELSHPRASVHVPAVVATENGTTVLNLFDKRYRENTSAGPSDNTAPGADPKLVKHPTEEEARKVPSIETEPLAEKDKEINSPDDNKANKEAMKDPLVKVGARPVSEAETKDDKTVAKNATVKVEKK